MGSALSYPPPLETLLRELRRLPGIGPKSAERMALWLLADSSQRSIPLAAAVQAAASSVRPCAKCGFFCVEELCDVCADPKRGGREICVVEHATDILPIERTGLFRGRYHSLGGKLSPLDHIGPDKLRIGELMNRLEDEQPTEVILALSADVEGGATTSYLAAMLKERGVPVSRVAHGLPAGGGLEHADSLTLQSALSGRSRI
jgi:recombination protein RecR